MTREISRRAFVGLVGGTLVSGAGCLGDDPKNLMVSNSTDTEISVHISINDGERNVVEESLDLAPATDEGWLKYYRSPTVVADREYEVTIIDLSDGDLNWDRRSEGFRIPYSESIYQIDIHDEGLTGVLSVP